MSFDNKTILIVGLVVGGLFSLYLNQSELSYAIFGGLIGYLSKDSITVKHEDVTEPVSMEDELINGSDSETA